MPDEAASAGVKKFSFIAYGDTARAADGTAIQYEHSLIVDSMLAQIKKLQGTEYPVPVRAAVGGRGAARAERQGMERELHAID